MGTWSHKPFGNDQTCDWTSELEESTGFGVIDQAFDQIIADKNEAIIDADFGSVAYAAAEVVAQILGEGTQDLDFLDGVTQWIDQLSSRAPNALIQKAIITLDILVQENSELDELWKESDDYDDWQKNIDELKELLSSKM